LHQAFVGTLFPELLPARESFARLLRGRVGLPARLDAAAKSSLPRARAADAERIVALTLDCLSADPRRCPDAVALRQRFAEVDTQIKLESLIRHWEFENQASNAAKLAALRQRSDPIEEPPPAPPANQDWSDIARKRRDAGDLSGALDAAWNSMRVEGPWHVRLYLGIVQLIASRGFPTRSELTTLLERLPEPIVERLDEADFLRMVHIKYRYLDIQGPELGRLDRNYASRWVEASSLLIRARLLLGGDTAYQQASRMCVLARKLFEAMPQGGGEAGWYARAYIDLLDGIAHVGAIGLFRDLSFCTDAFQRFTDCFRLAAKAGVESLSQASLRWLGWLANLTRGASEPPLSLIYAGIEGILRSQGLMMEEVSSGGIPEIPWYDEEILFPL
jgi:hypothetical protein